jgi:hypothetical protein
MFPESSLNVKILLMFLPLGLDVDLKNDDDWP